MICGAEKKKFFFPRPDWAGADTFSQASAVLRSGLFQLDK